MILAVILVTFKPFKQPGHQSAISQEICAKSVNMRFKQCLIVWIQKTFMMRCEGNMSVNTHSNECVLEQNKSNHYNHLIKNVVVLFYNIWTTTPT